MRGLGEPDGRRPGPGVRAATARLGDVGGVGRPVAGGANPPPPSGSPRQMRSAARSRAERLRGFEAISSGEGRRGRRVRTRSRGRCPHVQTG